MSLTPARAPRWLALLALAVLVVAGSAACSDDGGSEGAARSTTTTTRPRPRTTTSTTAPTTTKPGTPSTAPPSTTTPPSLPDTKKGYAEALSSNYDTADESNPFSPDEIDCMADEVVAAVGVQAFQDAGASADEIRDRTLTINDLDLNETQARAAVRAYGRCDIDIIELYRSGLNLEGITSAQERCVDELLTKENLEDLLVSQLTGESASDNPLQKLEDCVK